MTISCFCSYCGAENVPDNVFCIACQQSLDTSLAISHVPELLNARYEVQKEIGVGGFGAVYKARDMQEQGRFVAVKQINLKGLSSQEMIEATDAFNREAQLLSSFDHPLLPHIFDRFSDPEHWYLVMNFIEGLALDEYLQRHVASILPIRAGLPLDETLAIGLQICSVLHYLHTQQPPVIFRDLKPGNIIRSATGRVYLIDFGIARRFKPGQARDTIPFGSPGFAAPEQYGHAQTTPQADVYSLGALLHCLISGDDPSEQPFQFDPLCLDETDGIRELDALIQRMVAPSPAQRPADIENVQAELRNIQQIHNQVAKQSHIWLPPQGQIPPSAHPAINTNQQQIFLNPPYSGQATRKTTRRGVLLVGLLVGGTVLTGGLVASLINRDASHSQPANLTSDAIAATATAQSENDMATINSKLAVVPLDGPTYWSSDLSHAAVVNMRTRQVALYNVENQRLVNTIPVSGDLSSISVQWSPASQYIAFFQADRSGEIWDIQGKKKRFALPASLPGTTIVAWSTDEKSLVISYSDLSSHFVFALLNPVDGALLYQHNLAGNTITSLAWFSDNTHFIFPTINASTREPDVTWELEVWDSQTYQNVHSFSIPGPSYPVIALSLSPDDHQVALVSGNSFDGYLVLIGDLTRTNPVFQPTPYTDYSMLYQGPVWSSDGTRLAILTENGLHAWDVSSRQELPLSDNNVSGNVVAFVWSDDNQAITTVDDSNILAHWSVG